jgi:hypothetical protein
MELRIEDFLHIEFEYDKSKEGINALARVRLWRERLADII